jgi:hypothetical protein
MRTRSEQIAAIRADHQFWRDLAAEVGSDRYAEPGPMGEWSFGDMAGHLLGWRNRTIARLEAFSRGQPDPPNPWPAELEDDDRINEWIRDHHAGRSPAELVGDCDAAYDRLVEVIETTSDEKLMDPEAIPWVGSALVDVDFSGHLHDEHVPTVRAWLATLPT